MSGNLQLRSATNFSTREKLKLLIFFVKNFVTRKFGDSREGKTVLNCETLEMQIFAAETFASGASSEF